jgi:hypothetical protein
VTTRRLPGSSCSRRRALALGARRAHGAGRAAWPRRVARWDDLGRDQVLAAFTTALFVAVLVLVLVG